MRRDSLCREVANNAGRPAEQIARCCRVPDIDGRRKAAPDGPRVRGDGAALERHLERRGMPAPAAHGAARHAVHEPERLRVAARRSAAVADALEQRELDLVVQHLRELRDGADGDVRLRRLRDERRGRVERQAERRAAVRNETQEGRGRAGTHRCATRRTASPPIVPVASNSDTSSLPLSPTRVMRILAGTPASQSATQTLRSSFAMRSQNDRYWMRSMTGCRIKGRGACVAVVVGAVREVDVEERCFFTKECFRSSRSVSAAWMRSQRDEEGSSAVLSHVALGTCPPFRFLLHYRMRTHEREAELHGMRDGYDDEPFAHARIPTRKLLSLLEELVEDLLLDDFLLCVLDDRVDVRAFGSMQGVVRRGPGPIRLIMSERYSKAHLLPVLKDERRDIVVDCREIRQSPPLVLDRRYRNL